MSTATFAAYKQQLLGYKRGKLKYYQWGIEIYSITHGREVTADEAWSYFNNGDVPWTKRTFADHYYRIRRRLEDEKTTVELEENMERKT